LRKKYTFLEKKEVESTPEDTYRKSELIEIRSTEMEESSSPMPTSEDLETTAPHRGAVSGETDEPSPAMSAPEEDKGEEKASLEDAKQKRPPLRDIRYQQELIDQFISTKPTISKQQDPDKDEDKSPVDLSLQAPELEKDVVSETLARIFVKQGKLEKARDIYKKLIWKYPQKKAYFAAQIKDLKG
jgi:hypothetical protein